MQKIVILGGIGNGTIVAQAFVDAQNRGHKNVMMCGFLNDRQAVGSYIEEFPVLGKVKEVKKFTDEGYKIINTIYRIDGAEERMNLFESLKLSDEDLAIFVHPTAYVAPNAIISPGVVIMPHVMISASVTIGKGSILLNGSSVGHDTIIGMGTHIAAQAVVGSHIRIGKGVHIGLNATVREHLELGDYCTVGMGSVLTKNVGRKEIWVGNPARFLRMAD